MQLFTSFDDRNSRKTFWFGLFVFVPVGLALALSARSIVDPAEILARVLLFIAGLSLFYGAMALVTKRLHDRDRAANPRARLLSRASPVPMVGHGLRQGTRGLNRFERDPSMSASIRAPS